MKSCLHDVHNAWFYVPYCNCPWWMQSSIEKHLIKHINCYCTLKFFMPTISFSISIYIIILSTLLYKIIFLSYPYTTSCITFLKAYHRLVCSVSDLKALRYILINLNANVRCSILMFKDQIIFYIKILIFDKLQTNCYPSLFHYQQILYKC